MVATFGQVIGAGVSTFGTHSTIVSSTAPASSPTTERVSVGMVRVSITLAPAAGAGAPYMTTVYVRVGGALPRAISSL